MIDIISKNLKPWIRVVQYSPSVSNPLQTVVVCHCISTPSALYISNMPGKGPVSHVFLTITYFTVNRFMNNDFVLKNELLLVSNWFIVI